jgi:hypothetical protein
MRSSCRTIWASLLIAALLWCAPLTVCADLNNPLVVEPNVLGVEPFPGPESEVGLAVQATAWQRGGVLRYVVSITNFSSATVDSLYLLDRYFSDDPKLGEAVHDWFVDLLSPANRRDDLQIPRRRVGWRLPPDRVGPGRRAGRHPYGLQRAERHHHLEYSAE